MAWTVRYAASAAKAIRGLDPCSKRRVRAAIETLAYHPLRGKRLHLTFKGLRSWRTGDYRIVYRTSGERIEILVIAVGHRREIYDRLQQLIQEIPGLYSSEAPLSSPAPQSSRHERRLIMRGSGGGRGGDSK